MRLIALLVGGSRDRARRALRRRAGAWRQSSDGLGRGQEALPHRGQEGQGQEKARPCLQEGKAEAQAEAVGSSNASTSAGIGWRSGASGTARRPSCSTADATTTWTRSPPSSQMPRRRLASVRTTVPEWGGATAGRVAPRQRLRSSTSSTRSCHGPASRAPTCLAGGRSAASMCATTRTATRAEVAGLVTIDGVLESYILSPPPTGTKISTRRCFLHAAATELAADGDLGARPLVVLVAGPWDFSDPQEYDRVGRGAEGVAARSSNVIFRPCRRLGSRHSTP